MIEIVKVVVYEKATGKILNSGATCFPEKLETAEQAVLVNADAHITDDYVDRGEVKSKGPRPSEAHEFDYLEKRWVDRRTPDSQWAVVRQERGRLLYDTDWTQLPDVPQATKEMYADYRQALRDITNQEDPFNISWPTKPSA